MASLNFFFSPVVLTEQRRVSTAATSTKSSSGGGGGGSAEKGPFDWIVSAIAKPDQLLETDPILKKVEEKASGIGTTTSRKTTVAAPPAKKKNGGFGLGGLFAKE